MTKMEVIVADREMGNETSRQKRDQDEVKMEWSQGRMAEK